MNGTPDHGGNHRELTPEEVEAELYGCDVLESIRALAGLALQGHRDTEATIRWIRTSCGDAIITFDCARGRWAA